MSDDRAYVVLGPQRGHRIPICDDGSGPVEYECAYVEVTAPTRAEALRTAARQSVEIRDLMDEARGDGHHPYAYVRVVLNPVPDCPVCPEPPDDPEAEYHMCPTCEARHAQINKTLDRLNAQYGGEEKG